MPNLGVNTIWLLPFYPSPRLDDGYDISDYRGVHPGYGTLADASASLPRRTQRGMRVITELVVNHTSDQHPWFQRARQRQARFDLPRLYVWSTRRSQIRRHAHHLRRTGAIELDLGPDRRCLLLAPLLLPSARPEFRQSARAAGGSVRPALLAGLGVDGCASMPCHTWWSARAPTTRTCRRPTPC